MNIDRRVTERDRKRLARCFGQFGWSFTWSATAIKAVQKDNPLAAWALIETSGTLYAFCLGMGMRRRREVV